MAVDFATEIAEELVALSGYAPDCDIQRWADIIRKKWPLKEDVAYMPVPRCDGCKHWALDSVYIRRIGICAMQNSSEGQVSSDCGDYTIMTESDFGCVQFEAKA